MGHKSCLLCRHCLVVDMANNGLLSKIICDLFGMSEIKKAVSCVDYDESEFLRKLHADLSDSDV